MTTSITIGIDELRRWCTVVLQTAGASAAAAGATADCLVDASRRGLDSHGVVFLSFYLPRLRAGTTKGDAEPVVEIDLPALALVDGRDGLGAYVGRFAMELCCSKARSTGAAAVAVRDSSHFGAASFYAEVAAAAGCVGLVFSNSDPGMAPLGALGPILGTNPLAIAAPAPPHFPRPSLDIATSVVAQGRIILAARSGASIPEEWAIGRDGRPTTDPDEALLNSVLPMAGHKGFGLAFMIDVLTACLSGALLSPEIPGDPNDPRPQKTGHFFVAVNVESLRDQKEYEQSLCELISRVHTAPRADWAECFLIPGEREALVAKERAVAIPLTEPTLALLRNLGEDYGAPFPH